MQAEKTFFLTIILHYYKKGHNATKIFEKLNNIYKSDVL